MSSDSSDLDEGVRLAVNAIMQGARYDRPDALTIEVSGGDHAPVVFHFESELTCFAVWSAFRMKLPHARRQEGA